MAIPTSLSELEDYQVSAVIVELETIDPDIGKKVQYVVSHAGGAKAEALEYVVLDSPALWAYVYLNWVARDYQIEILKQGKRGKKIVLRLGRRLGKTETMCILILWYAFTQYNKDPKAQDGIYDILIITPFETQVDLIFKRLHQLIDMSPFLQSKVTRDVYHNIRFGANTNIVGMTAGSKTGTGAANTRGQRADLIILDEMDYMGSSEVTNILNIRNEAPERIKIIVSSTPSGRHEEFYTWCVNASSRFAPPQSDIDNFEFTGYIHEKNVKGNGWIEVYAPSIVNKELLKINPDTQQTYLADIKDELTELRYAQEVMAEFGEEEMGVYQKKYIDIAIEEGLRVNHRYTTDYDPQELEEFLKKPRTGPRLLGVDWDKYGATTNMVCVELDKLFMNKHGVIEPKFKVLFRIEIPKSNFTYTNAINKIIELNDIYDFDWIPVDRGYGETQIEILHQYGIDNTATGLADKVVGYQFSEKIDVRDPHTMKKDKKPLKPFMVNNSVNIFEKEKIIFNPNDKKMIAQFEQYKVKSISPNGVPTYSDKNEHIVDALNLCLLSFEQNYGALLRRIISSKVLLINGNLDGDNTTPSRALEKKPAKIFSLINIGGRQGYISEPRERQKRPARFTRGTF